MEIKVLGTGCPKCDTLEARAREALLELGLPDAVIKVKDIEQILAHGVALTPALVVDGEIKSTGRLPDKEEIKAWLKG